MHSSSSFREEVNLPLLMLCAKKGETVPCEYLPKHGDLVFKIKWLSSTHTDVGPHKETWGEVTVHLPQHVAPSLSTSTGFSINIAEAKAQPLLPITAHLVHTSWIPSSHTGCCSPQCDTSEEQPALALAQSSRGVRARQGSWGRNALLPQRRHAALEYHKSLSGPWEWNL